MSIESLAATYVALDIGGTFLKGALVEGAGRLVERLHEPVVKDSLGALLSQLGSAVKTLDPEGRALAVGIGIPGIVAHGRSQVLTCANLPALDGFSLGMEMAHRSGRPTFLENDANAAALAEAWLGAGRGSENQLLVTLGTGIGGGIILNGRIWSGVNGFAGELGHIQVDPHGVPCGCGSRGCLETVAGLEGWRRRAKNLLGSRASVLTAEALDPAAIVDAAKAGDAVALDVVDHASKALGAGIAAVLLVLNLDRVVIAGGVSAAGPFLLDRIVDHTRRRMFARVFSECRFALAELGGDAGVVGAARVAMVGLDH